MGILVGTDDVTTIGVTLERLQEKERFVIRITVFSIHRESIHIECTGWTIIPIPQFHFIPPGSLVDNWGARSAHAHHLMLHLRHCHALQWHSTVNLGV
jgi:hypothetical protein